MSIYLFIW